MQDFLRKPVEPLPNPNDPENDRANGAIPLQALGAGKTPLNGLKPILGIPKALRDPRLKPKNESFAAERVALFAREQLAQHCQVPFRTIEAKKVTDTVYRVNWLANDTSEPKRGAGQPKPGLVVTTNKRVHSELVRVVWNATSPDGKNTIILTRISDDSKQADGSRQPHTGTITPDTEPSPPPAPPGPSGKGHGKRKATAD